MAVTAIASNTMQRTPNGGIIQSVDVRHDAYSRRYVMSVDVIYPDTVHPDVVTALQHIEMQLFRSQYSATSSYVMWKNPAFEQEEEEEEASEPKNTNEDPDTLAQILERLDEIQQALRLAIGE